MELVEDAMDFRAAVLKNPDYERGGGRCPFYNVKKEGQKMETGHEPEKRMAGNYEITLSIHVGDREVVFGVDEREEMPYFCAFYKRNDLFGAYEDCMVSDDYVEMAGLFAKRISGQCMEVQREQAEVTVPRKRITAEMCLSMNGIGNLEGKVMAVKAEALRPEYRTADHQLVLVTGGNGAREGSLGTACFSTNLYSGKRTRWERYDFQGEVKKECLPQWAVERLKKIKEKEAEKEPAKRKEER